MLGVFKLTPDPKPSGDGELEERDQHPVQEHPRLFDRRNVLLGLRVLGTSQIRYESQGQNLALTVLCVPHSLDGSSTQKPLGLRPLGTPEQP